MNARIWVINLSMPAPTAPYTSQDLKSVRNAQDAVVHAKVWLKLPREELYCNLRAWTQLLASADYDIDFTVQSQIASEIFLDDLFHWCQ